MKLAHGLKDGQLVHVSIVDRGKACACTCPSCGAPLLAHKGEKIAHHFKHTSDHDCAHARETIVHQLAKGILEQTPEFCLPPHRLTRTVRLRGGSHMALDECVDAAQRCYPVDRVRTEQRLGTITPDLILTLDGHDLLVEIAVTHFVDNEKARRIRHLGMPCIEIDLSGLPTLATREDIRDMLLDPANARWVHHRKEGKARARLDHRMERLGAVDASSPPTGRHERLAEDRKKRVARPAWIGTAFESSVVIAARPDAWQRALFDWVREREPGEQLTVESLARQLPDRWRRIPGEVAILQRAGKATRTVDDVLADFLDALIKEGILFRSDSGDAIRSES